MLKVKLSFRQKFIPICHKIIIIDYLPHLGGLNHYVIHSVCNRKIGSFCKNVFKKLTVERVFTRSGTEDIKISIVPLFPILSQCESNLCLRRFYTWRLLQAPEHTSAEEYICEVTGFNQEI